MELYKKTDILDGNFIRIPTVIIAHPKYRQLSSDAKILYSLLRNRLQLSQHNDWVNESGEVYLIFTREQAADVLGVGYKTAIKTFKELIKVGLLYEQRRGNNMPNHIYLTKLENYNEKEINQFDESFDSKPDEKQDDFCVSADVSNLHITTRKNDISKPVNSTVSDVSNLHTSNINNKNNNIKNNEISQSISQNCCHSAQCADEDFLTDRQTYLAITKKCNFNLFGEDMSNVLHNAVERLFYSKHFKVGNAILPQETIRRYLWRIDTDILCSVYDTICKNTTRIKNPTAYVMSMIINALSEYNFDMYAFSYGHFPNPNVQRE